MAVTVIDFGYAVIVTVAVSISKFSAVLVAFIVTSPIPVIFTSPVAQFIIALPDTISYVVLPPIFPFGYTVNVSSYTTV